MADKYRSERKSRGRGGSCQGESWSFTLLCPIFPSLLSQGEISGRDLDSTPRFFTIRSLKRSYQADLTCLSRTHA